MALLASIGSPPSDSGVEQSPLWTASAYASSEGEVTASVEDPLHLELEMAFTVPEGGSGSYTTSLSFGADVYEGGRATWSATLSSEDGTALDEVELIESSVELSARDVAPGCEPGERCTARVFVDLVPTVGTVTIMWEATFTARDNVLGEGGEYAEASVSVVGE